MISQVLLRAPWNTKKLMSKNCGFKPFTCTLNIAENENLAVDTRAGIVYKSCLFKDVEISDCPD